MVDTQPLSDADEEALVVAAQADPAAFDALYRCYQQRVARYVRAQVSNPEDAADITQQVFVQAMHGLRGFRRAGSFRAWLFTIVRHTLANYRRQRPALSWELAPEGLQPLDEQTPETLAIQDETLRDLAGLLAQLDPEKRDLLALRFAAQLPITEIATIVGKNPDAVRMQLKRTIHALKEQYDAIA